MSRLLDLPPEILDVLAGHLVMEKADPFRWDQFPLTCDADDIHSPSASRALANLTQVNRQLRCHFKPILWREITIYYISDIEKLDRFLCQSSPSVYGKSVWRLRFSWWDDIVGNEMQAEHDISSYEEEELGLGSMKEWIFKDRVEWWKGVSRSQLSEWHPDWTEEEIERVADEPLPYPYTSGPDGRGPVSGMHNMADVEGALQRVFRTFSSLKHLEWNARLLSFPSWLPPLVGKLESLVLFHENLDQNHCASLITACQQIQCLTLLDFKHGLFAYKDLKVDCPNLHFCPISPESPLGIAYDCGESDPALGTLCKSLLTGIRHRLDGLILNDWNILRVEKLLPIFLALKTIQAPIGDHDWDSCVETCDVAPFTALKELRDALSPCNTVEDLADRCKDLNRQVTKHKPTGQRIDQPGRLDVHELLQWLVDDRRLTERAFVALQKRRSQ